MRSFAQLAVVLLGALIVLPSDAAAGTWRIGRDQNDCDPPCHWYDGHPLVTIPGQALQTALINPSVTVGDTIRVWPGNYTQRCQMRSGVVVISDQGPEVTSVIGNAGNEPGFLWIATSALSKIIGFTIGWDATATATGGGIAAYVSEGTIRDCIFRNCRAGIGSAVYLQFCSGLTLENNVFYDNLSDAGGGVIAVSGGDPLIRNNTIVLSQVPFGLEGAALYASASDVQFEHNIVTESMGGTAIFCAGTNNPRIECNILWDNEMGAYGGTCADSSGTAGNLSEDPLLCNPAGGNFGVCTDSPALGGACGTIGYVSPAGNCAACGPVSAGFLVEPLSWGRVKGLYR